LRKKASGDRLGGETKKRIGVFSRYLPSKAKRNSSKRKGEKVEVTGKKKRTEKKQKWVQISIWVLGVARRTFKEVVKGREQEGNRPRGDPIGRGGP